VIEQPNSALVEELAKSTSVIIATTDRPDDLEACLSSLLIQTVLPKEIVIVDDSLTPETHRVTKTYAVEFAARSVTVKYVRNKSPRSLAAARNTGVDNSSGGIILFLDDDTVLDHEYLKELLSVFATHNDAVGVQGWWQPVRRAGLAFVLRNSMWRMLFLFCYARNRCDVRPSFSATYPHMLAGIRKCSWLSGCNQAYLRSVLARITFDQKLKRYSFGEDLDFSYRVFKQFPYRLYINPRAHLAHKALRSRFPRERVEILMQFVYSKYLFHKNMPQTRRNRLAFLISEIGRVLETLVRVPGTGTDQLKFAMEGFKLAWMHGREISEGDLSFFDKFLE